MDAFSKELRSFLRQNFDSLEDLEILMLIYGDGKPEKFWDATEISSHLGIDPISLSNRLEVLANRGLLIHRPGAGVLYGYRFELAHKEQEPVFNELLNAYRTAKMRLIDVLMAAHRNVLADFADAFVLKKDGDG